MGRVWPTEGQSLSSIHQHSSWESWAVRQVWQVFGRLLLLHLSFQSEKTVCRLGLLREHHTVTARTPARVVREHGQLGTAGPAAFWVYQQEDKTLLNTTSVPRGQTAFTEGGLCYVAQKGWWQAAPDPCRSQPGRSQQACWASPSHRRVYVRQEVRKPLGVSMPVP